MAEMIHGKLVLATISHVVKLASLLCSTSLVTCLRPAYHVA